MKTLTILAVSILLLAVSTLSAATHYVSLESTNPTPPYANWATAATNIQDAVNVAATNEVILVTNGVYPGRVTVTNPLALVSANGPRFTVIDGARTNQCISLSDGGSLTGFTVTNGWVFGDGGGVWCASTNVFLTNCVIANSSADGYEGSWWPVPPPFGGNGGGVYGGALFHCTLTGNSTHVPHYFGQAAGAAYNQPQDNEVFVDGGSGGAAYGSILRDCILDGNAADLGGGANACSLYNCTLTGNLAFSGGGADSSTLYDCTLTSNSATELGGGAEACTLDNCTLTGNSALYGGGASESTLYSCALTGNFAAGYAGFPPGGGAYRCTLYNCALTGNSYFGAAGGALYNCTVNGNAGGVAGAALYNSILCFNAVAGAANYDTNSTLNYCCTTPLPTKGVGNIALDPQLASASHLGANSPCRGAGSAAYASGTDIDGESWGNPPSMGCDEYHPGAVTGPLTVTLLADYTNVTVGYPVSLTALIEGRTTESVWVFGDGDVDTNQIYVTHTWSQGGDFLVSLWAFNDSHPEGVSANLTIHVVAHPVYYVSATGLSPQPPYASWATAATNIQDAVDAAAQGAMATVVVTNGVYRYGGRDGTRVLVERALAIRSVNGPSFTVIDGGGTNPCVVALSGSASLTGFTLTNGSVGVASYDTSGVVSNCVMTGNWVRGGNYGSQGGAFGCTLYDCRLTGNSSTYDGGGACACTLYNCTLTGNSATYDGGGACWSTLYNCTLTGNSASRPGGGASYSTLYNCIVYSNTAPGGANYDTNSTLNYCCTTPLPTNGVGNISNAPLFVDYAAGNLRLQSNSPCINIGNNSYLTNSDFTNCFDLDGRARVTGGTVDMGAYEFQPGISGAFIAWLQQYGLPTDGSADFIDSDRDGHNSWQEWVCGTCPTNAASALRLTSAFPTGRDVTVSWQSAAGINYLLERSANLAVPFTVLATNIVGQPGTTSYADTNATGAGLFFYRVGVVTP